MLELNRVISYCFAERRAMFGRMRMLTEGSRLGVTKNVRKTTNPTKKMSGQFEKIEKQVSVQSASTKYEM